MMDEIKRQLIALNKDESGATATEYLVILILVACVLIPAVSAFGEIVKERMNDAQTAVAEDVTFD